MSLTVPNFKQPAFSGDIVGFNFQNAGTLDLTARNVTFAQEFAPGALVAGQALMANIDGKSEAVQADAKTFNADGSVSMAVLTLSQPAIKAESSLQGMLAAASTLTAPAPSVDLAAFVSHQSIVVNLAFQDSTISSVDVSAALKAALADGTASTWLSGPQATQSRVSIPVSGALRLLATVTGYADGTFSTKIGFNNDIAMSASGGPVTYSASIVQDGATVWSQSSLTQYQYQDWNATVYGGTGSAPSVNIQHDSAYLEKIGAIPNFDLANGVDAGVVASEGQAVATAGWNAPLATDGVTTYMPTTGGRGDIGPTTQANAAWLVSQDPTAASFALAQAAAAGAVPWNMWNPAAGTYLNTDQYPNIWTDGRGGPSSYTTGLTQQVDQIGSGWTPDASHQPDLSYDAYLMTGDQTYLDNLNAQASFSIVSAWPATRGADLQLVVDQQQVRGAAWNLREVDEASYANPVNSLAGQYYTKISDVNWKWLVAQIPAWTTLQGQAYGQVEGSYGYPSAIAPWQQDYFASTAVEAAQHGNADALTFLKWQSNFLVGRFLQGTNGFSPNDGVDYNLQVNTGGTRYFTWAQIEAATAAVGQSNGTGWAQSDGDYAALALQSLAGIITVTGSTDAIKAYNWLLMSGAPHIDKGSMAASNQFDIVPQLKAGMAFAADGTIVMSGAPSTPPSNPGPTSQTTATIMVGSGPDVLALQIAEDAYQGDAQYTVSVDGKQVGGVQTATASHGAGSTQALDVLGRFGPGTHTATVNFLNDAYGGSPATDRNLYVTQASLDNTAVPASSMAEYSGGAQSFTFQGAAAALDTLTLGVSEDAWQGDAQYTVSVDGKQVGGVYSATASHAAGKVGQQVITGSWGGGAHSVGITFINDAWGGTAATDRNLYVNAVNYDGAAVAINTIAQNSNGTASIATPVIPLLAGAPLPDTLTLGVSEDAWQGDAQYTVSVDGKQAGGVYTATASYTAGLITQQTISGSFGKGPHTVGITFINDLWGGTPDTDRNLYVNSVQYDGASVTMTTIAQNSNGMASVVTPVAASPNILTLHMSEDAYRGDAQFTVAIDGKQTGGTQTVTAPNTTGTSQAFSFASTVAAGTHDVTVSFLNALQNPGGSNPAGRTLYVAGADLNGTGLSAPVWGGALTTTSTSHFSLVVPS